MADLWALVWIVYCDFDCEFVTFPFGILGQVWYLILSVTSHINCIVARCLINGVYLTACCLYQVMMTLHFLIDVANYAEPTQNRKLRHNR